MLISRVYTPENSFLSPGADLDRPINKVSIEYLPPAGQTVVVDRQLSVMINGVSLMGLLDGTMPTPVLANLQNSLWRGQYLISLAQVVSQTISGVVTGFSTGETFLAKASWAGQLPVASRAYREHGWGFMKAGAYVRRNMDPLWTEHEDAEVIRQVVGTMLDGTNQKTIRMINVRDSSYVKYVEPIDRIDGVTVEMLGAVSAGTVPYIDIEALYQVAENSRAFLMGYDYIINRSGQLVFHCSDAPGRISGTSEEMQQGQQPEQPTDSAVFSNPVSIPMQLIPMAVFADTFTGLFTGFDFFITPPRLPDSSGYVSGDGSDYVGKIVATIPKTGETFVLYNPDLDPNTFSGSVKLASPISFSVADYIQIFQVRPSFFVNSLGFPQNDANPVIDVKLWLNRSVTLIGPHAHQANDRLKYMWSQIVGGPQSSVTLQDRLRVLSGMKARTEKSVASFATYTEALLGLPLSPFEGAYVMSVVAPSPKGYVNGQIDIYGAVQEFDGNPAISVAPGDKVKLLQSLFGPADGVTITDVYNDPNFLVFQPNGTPPVDDPFSVDYLRSKIVGAVQLPDDFVAQYPTGTEIFFVSAILRWSSFRINLGAYASRKLVANPDLVPQIFAAIDAVKPSGADYWIRLSDGTSVIRPVSTQEFFDISSELDLPTDHAYRIFHDNDFAANQYKNFYISANFGALPVVGDIYQVTIVDTSGPTTYLFSATMLASDFVLFPLFPLDGPLSRIAAAINANVTLSPNIVATQIDRMLQIKVNQNAASQQAIKCVTPLIASAAKVSGTGSVSFTPNPSNPGPIAGYDISRIWSGFSDAVNTLSAYKELPPTATAPNPTVADIADYGTGPYDPTFLPVTFGVPLVISFQMPTGYPEAGFKAGRLSLEGYAASTGADTGSVTLGFNAFGGFTTGDTLTVTVSGGYFPNPIVFSRVMLLDDETPGCVFLGIGRQIETDPTLQQFFRCVPVNDGTKKKVTIIPHNVDDYAVLNTVVFTITTITAGAPTFTVANSAGPVAGNVISPLQLPAPDLVASFSWAPLLSCPVTIQKRIHAPDETGAANYFRYDWSGFPVTFVNGVITITLTIPVATVRTIDIFNCRAVVNDYPEYSRDDNAMTMDAVTLVQGRLGTFTDGAVVYPPPYPAGYLPPDNPPITVIENLPIYYTEKFSGTVDVTPRMVAPSQTLQFIESVDFRWQEIYLAGLVAARTVTQSGVPIFYKAGSPILYVSNVNGSFTRLVVGTDYAETTPTTGTITLINTGAHPALTTARVVGFVESGLYIYYFDAPGRPTLERTSWLNSAPGVRALYDELDAITTAEKNRFRQVNAGNLGPKGGAAIIAPYNVPDYLASGVKDNPAFGDDGNSVQITDSINFDEDVLR